MPGLVALCEAVVEPTDIPRELETDTAWEDVYDNTPVTNFAVSDDMSVVEYETQRIVTESLSDHLRWQLGLTNPDNNCLRTHLTEARWFLNCL